MADFDKKTVADFPELVAQWHPTKNGDLTPDQVSSGNGKKVWWKCNVAEDHEWEAVVSSRTSGCGCPACRGLQVSTTNSLASLKPEIAHQWHPTKNGVLTSSDVTVGSRKRVWWKCREGPDHEWEATVQSRNQGNGCGFCAGQRVSVTNSLASLRPDVAAFWHFTKNGTLTPHMVTTGAGKKVWWKCPNGPDHEWFASINTKVAKELNCPCCSGRKLSVTNSLAAKYPEIAQEWHPTKNVGSTPNTTVAGTAKKVWWKCSKGPDHEWEASVTNRTRLGRGCAFCAGKQVSVTNSLTSLAPEIAKQWHPTKNGGLTPDQFTSGSGKKVWWLCDVAFDHEWPSTVASRVRENLGCPCCSGRRASITNSVASKNPELAAEWHPTKNGELMPHAIAGGSNKKVWWKCSAGPDHEWKTTVYHRIKDGQGCPFCRNLRISITNSLQTKYPEIAAEWHPERNGNLKPNLIVYGSKKKVWWQCRQNISHIWKTSLSKRTHSDRGCPQCNVGWTVQGVRNFVESILPYLSVMTPAELHVCFQQSGMAEATGKSKSFIKALATGRFPLDEVEKFATNQLSLVDDFLTGELEDLAAAEEAGFLDDDDLGVIDEQAEATQAEVELPLVATKDALAALDFHVIASSDEEAVQFFIASALGKLWRHAYEHPNEAIAQAQAFTGGEYAGRVRDTFITEFKAATTLEIPIGYDFRPAGQLAQPNLMQRLVAVRIRDNKRYGNWSGTGAGKTLSAVLATRVVAADLTVICCPNAVVKNWEKEIRHIFPDSVVVTKTWEPTWPTDDTRPRYVVQNFEQFQQSDSEGRIKSFCKREQVKFIIIDEIHYAKQRHAEQMSRRKRLVNGMVAAEGEENPDLYVLGMSATPVINNLTEGRSLVEMITGLTHEDLEIKATVANCMRLYQKLVTLGTRWKPNYEPQLNKKRVAVDCSEYLDEIRALGKKHSPLALEKILTAARLPTILEHCERGKKTLVYTLYVDEIDKMLYDALTAKGLKVGLYTGDDKSGLPGFLDGDVDVLIGSSSIGTGVDGLQHVCNQLIINVLPWTNAEYEQLVGRVYRQGQKARTVNVIIPITYARVNGERWSYCDSKLKRIEYKRSIADAAVDGAVPEGNLRTPAQAQRDVMTWLDRLDRGETAQIVRTRITVPLSDSDEAAVARRLRTYGDFSTMNARWNTSRSDTLAQRLSENPEEWEQYHTLYRQSRESWTVVPFQEMVQWAAERQGHIIGDFGCGEALFAKAVSDRHTVHSFDHIAINNAVVAGDMSHTSLDDESLDDAIFCLSLMGANVSDYLREAYRVLKLDGALHIWEATSRFDDPKRFAKDLSKLGFKVHEPEERGKFTHIEARKTVRVPDKAFRLSFKANKEL